MNAVHLVLQGKGGVGKSLISSILAQYFQEKEISLFCADTDPVNHTFSQYASLNVRRIEVLENENHINSRAFDTLVELLIKHDGVAVIDNGASSFVPLSSYIKENNLIEFLTEAGKEVFIHTIITGGQAMDDTLIGLSALFKALNAQIIVWQNEFFGAIENDGKKLKQFTIIRQNCERIKGFVTLQKRNYDTCGKDIELMVSKKMTFNEAIASEDMGLMPRHRLKIIKTDIFDQLRTIGL